MALNETWQLFAQLHPSKRRKIGLPVKSRSGVCLRDQFASQVPVKHVGVVQIVFALFQQACILVFSAIARAFTAACAVARPVAALANAERKNGE